MLNAVLAKNVESCVQLRTRAFQTHELVNADTLQDPLLVQTINCQQSVSYHGSKFLKLTPGLSRTILMQPPQQPHGAEPLSLSLSLIHVSSAVT
jgi:hypothetical protein